jgi:hypothetical protein
MYFSLVLNINSIIFAKNNLPALQPLVIHKSFSSGVPLFYKKHHSAYKVMPEHYPHCTLMNTSDLSQAYVRGCLWCFLMAGWLGCGCQVQKISQTLTFFEATLRCGYMESQALVI